METLRFVGMVVTLVASWILLMFTVREWHRLEPIVVRTIMVIFNAILLALIYGYWEAAHQHAPMGLRVVLVLVPIAGLVLVLVAHRIHDRGRRRT